jgi:hypothetical protein
MRKPCIPWSMGLCGSPAEPIYLLERSISETITLDKVEEAFHKMERGEVLRFVVVF